MVPLSTLVTLTKTYGPTYTNRFNLYRSAQLLGGAAPGYSSGQALTALEEVAKATLPSEMGYDFADLSYQERKASGNIVTGGFVKIHVRDGSDKILGTTIVARHAGEMINEISLAMVAGIGLQKLAQVVRAYPTQAEAIRMAADHYNETRLTPLHRWLLRTWLHR